MDDSTSLIRSALENARSSAASDPSRDFRLAIITEAARTGAEIALRRFLEADAAGRFVAQAALAAAREIDKQDSATGAVTWRTATAP